MSRRSSDIARVLIRVILSATVLLAGCTETVPLRVLPNHGSDQVIWLADALPAFQVQCATGIGSALIKPTQKSWPARFNVVLELRSLEGFIVVSGEERHRLEVTREGQLLVEPADSDVLHMSGFEAIGKDFRFRIEINPNNFADATSEVGIEWVDYYR